MDNTPKWDVIQTCLITCWLRDQTMRTFSSVLIMALAVGCSAPREYVAPAGKDAVAETSSPISVSVDGEVQHPQESSFPGGIRLADAIARAGGFTEFAARHKVKVLHRDGTCCRYNLLHPGKKDYGGDVRLRDGDTVLVPRRLS